MIHPQILKTFIQHPPDMLLTGDPFLYLILRPGKKFCCHHDLLPLRIILQRPAEILLAGTALISDRRIKKINAQLQSPPDDLTGMLLVNRPGMLAVCRISESHAAHADAGNRQICISQFRILHHITSYFKVNKAESFRFIFPYSG